MRSAMLPVMLALALAAAARAEDTPATRLSLKGLAGVAVQVAAISPEARKDGLTAEAIRAAVAARLGKARIRILSGDQQQQSLRRPCLRVSVVTSKLETGEYLYSVEVEVVQWVASLANPKLVVTAAIPSPAQTWAPNHVLGITPAKQIGQDVQTAVGSMVDDFVDAFYKANPSQTAFESQPGRKLQ